MKTTTKITVIQAVNLANAVYEMRGNQQENTIRKGLVDAILQLFPEAEDPKKVAELKDECRELELDEQQLQVLSTGLLTLAENVTLQKFNAILAVAESVKLKKWLEKRIGNAQQVPGFTGELDDDEPLSEESSPLNP